MKDQGTIDYFDRNVPEFHEARLDRSLAVIREYAHADTSLVDVGCGVGNILELVARQTCVRHLSGIDVSSNCLQKAQERLTASGFACEPHQGSILDMGFVQTLSERFDFVLLAAVLHHLIGRTRSASRCLAEKALTSCIELLRPGGYLIIAEPVFYPRITMDVVFWIKKLVTAMTDERVSIFGYWNNLGAPVVSYYRTEDLIEMLKKHTEAEIKDVHLVDKKRNLLFKLAMITAHRNATIVVKKPG